MKKPKQLLKYGIPALILILVVGAYFIFKKKDLSGAEQFLTSKVARGTIRKQVSSTGTLQAVITVQVGSQVSGRIQEIHADFNSVVKKGQMLAIIDPANFQAQRERSLAQLATAEASVKNAESAIDNRNAELVSATANIEVAQVTLKDAERQQKRSESLFKDGVMSERDRDNAQLAFDQGTARLHQAEAQMRQSEANIRSASAQLEQARANVKQARAELQMADVNLHYTNIIAPIDGVVVERNVDIGQTVAASLQAPTLFLLANDLSKMQVIAQVDEADIGSISEKAQVEFTVDAFPGQNFRGQISEIRFSSKLPTTTTSGSGTSAGGSSNVVVYNVIVDVDNPQLKLRPAMTANVNFTVSQSENVLKLANAALRFRPSDKTPEEIQKLMATLPSVRIRDGAKPQNASDARPSGAFRPQTVEASSSTPADRGMRGEGQLRGGAGGGMLGMQGQRNGTPGMGGMSRMSGGGRTPGFGSRGGGALAEIGPSLHDQFGIEGGMKIRFPNAENPRPVWNLVWVLDNTGKPQPRKALLGITDGRETAVITGELKEADQVITADLNDIQQSPTVQGASPFRGPFGGMGGGPRRTGGR